MNENTYPQLAAIDLGSNSFHMIVVRIEDGHVHVVDKIKEMIRLGGGLDEENNLTPESQSKAIACLERFGDRIKHLPQNSVAAVGTNTMRRANNSRQFLVKAEKALGRPISIIAGREEARLIYLGVSHSLAKEDDTRRFVMDIGGGSTELIIGENFQPIHLESLPLGCVSMSKHFFADGKLNKSRWEKANTEAHLKLLPFKKHYRQLGWNSATGASGSIKSIGKVIQALELAPFGITLENLYKIRDRLIEAKTLDDLKLPGLSDDRRPVFAGGLAVLIAVFEALKIDYMQVSDGALREGLIYELLGRIQHEDTRIKTIERVQDRFQISLTHAKRVHDRAMILFTQVACDWELSDTHARLLSWAANLHEIGLSVSHSGYQKHGAYMLQYADLPGFSQWEQNWMSFLVRYHRNKLSSKGFDLLPDKDQDEGLQLLVLLRLAVLLHRSRQNQTITIENVEVCGNNKLQVSFAEDELQEHQLLQADLEKEQKQLKKVDFKLIIKPDINLER
jgi:exopolyphosphatase/guanosine-5'-triphosphate,3'-diphosphate pyrophosphatase